MSMLNNSEQRQDETDETENDNGVHHDSQEEESSGTEEHPLTGAYKPLQLSLLSQEEEEMDTEATQPHFRFSEDSSDDLEVEPRLLYDCT